MAGSNISDGIKGKACFDERESNVPAGYGDNKIVLMARDPWTLYAYWEIREDVETGLKRGIVDRGLVPQKSILRLYDITKNVEVSSAKITRELELKNFSRSWYINGLSAERHWLLDIGIVCTTGEFFCLARSNVVCSPADRMSDICDEEWMCPADLYYKMFAVAGGYDIGKSSLEIKGLIDKHLADWRSSGGMSSESFWSADLFDNKRKKE
ncbi:MAG: DUF4912 domain-containing protein [Candidatus Omnitrophota bacterium]